MIPVDVLDDTIRTRRSVRRYRPDAVPRDLLEQLIELAAWAPSAGNRQDWQFLIVTSESRRTELAAAVRSEWDRLLANPEVASLAEQYGAYVRNFDWFAAAPAVIVVTAKAPESCMNALLGGYARDVTGGCVSAAMAVQNLLLAAHARGLGTCCLTGPLAASETLKQQLDIGTRRDIVCLVAVGYPAESSAAPPRKPQTEIVRYID